MPDRRNLTEAIRRGEEERHRLIEERLKRRAEREQAELAVINQVAPSPVQAVPQLAPQPSVPKTPVESRQKSEDFEPEPAPKLGAQLGAQTPKIGRPDAQNWAPNSSQQRSTALGAQNPSDWAPNPEVQPSKWSARHGERYFPSRQLKGRLHLRLTVEILEALEGYCERFECDRQDVVEEALRQFLGAQLSPFGRPKTEKIGRPNDWAPNHDDHDHDDDNKIIIMYEQMTGNRATARDRATADEIRHLNPEAVRRGIALTVSRAKSRINSLRYCLGAIREVAGQTPDPPPVKSVPTLQSPVQPVDDTPSGWTDSKTELRLVAARLREIHHGEPDYSRDRLREDLRTTLIAMGRTVDDHQLEDALGTHGQNSTSM